jgi:phosphoribosylaminoimidazolecarboxamide formyltransferase/IMP cyclohydrolase
MTIPLKYGCNPNQSTATLHFASDCPPLRVVNGNPSTINILDALRSWQLVRELKAVAHKPAAASFKHVSPAGVAVAGPISSAFAHAQFIADDDALSPIATAYAKARSSDRIASFGDFIAVSDSVDESLAQLIKPEVSDGIIAPSYDAAALELLKQKKRGNYVILEMDPTYQPSDDMLDSRTDFGITLKQSRNTCVINADLFSNRVTQNKDLSDYMIETLIVATVTLKHTQSNSIVVGYAGQAVGVGAGQQSRIACTRLACDKADRWLLKMHPKSLSLVYNEMPRSEKVNALDQFVRYHELDERERQTLQSQLTQTSEPISEVERRDWIHSFKGIVLGSDAFFPFCDNLDRAARSGVSAIAQAGGSARDSEVIATADTHNMVMAMTGLRLFLH